MDSMKSNFTLKLNKRAVEKAKRYARKNNQSLSILVENHFNTICGKHTSPDIDISPNALELSEIIKLNENLDLKREYHVHLLEKNK